MQRSFWLDGPAWDGGPPSHVELAPDDVSLTYDASRRHVTVHPSGELIGQDIFTVLEQQLAQAGGDPDTYWVGAFGYAARPELGLRTQPGHLDAFWMRTRQHTTTAATTSHHHDAVAPEQQREEQARQPAEAPLQHKSALAPFEAATPASTDEVAAVPPGWYRESFAGVQAAIAAGKLDEVNLTYRQVIASSRAPLQLYRRLQQHSPAPYTAALHHGRQWLISASPERFLQIDAHHRIWLRPMKGTLPRGTTAQEDQALAHQLATDAKFRTENLLTVEALKAQLAPLCTADSITTPARLQVETYPAVHQLTTTLTGQLRPEVSSVAAIRRLFPSLSVTGVPAGPALEKIEQVEPQPRGLYGGVHGWISGDGRAELAVTIRSAHARHHPAGAPEPTRWWVGTGGGITAESQLDQEWAESTWKISHLRTVLET